ncbi:hypothetical protein [Candidatus Oscillochloris fontis]|uniref:hypothetical protein n=1 Tax=Candidatus Oscillochloris fontis TaxID=2496868 RepID=UPI00101D8288|nr:hypothetical protein [Candidatus Oscillochloris fontis]
MARKSSMRSIPEGAALRNRPPGHTKASPTGERTRLEGERARLQQEVTAWQRNLDRAQSRLHLVEEQLAALNGELRPAAPKEKDADAGTGTTAGFSTFTFEY